ncbi:MAG: ATP-binding protein [Thermoplasmata archaeon]|nr:MAG: ATP-binding protein [Thermoplasmata archaeon]
MIGKKVKHILEENNLWWQSKGISPDVPKFERDAVNTLKKASLHKAIVLIGTRQSGKTTVMLQTIKHLIKCIDPTCIVYAPMDRLKGASINDVVLAHQELTGKSIKSYYFFDEVHNDKDWSVNLKAKIDAKTGNYYYATGSSATLLLKDVAESGLGRFIFEHIMPLSFREFAAISGIQPKIKFEFATIENVVKKELPLISEQHRLESHFHRFLLYGGFPAQFSYDYELAEWQNHLRQNYVSLSIYKDILSNYEVRDPSVLEDMLYLVAEKTSLPLSYESIAKSFNLTIETVRTYLNYLESAGLIISCEYYTKNLLKRQRRNKKFYIIDPGFNAALNYAKTLTDDITSKNVELSVAIHLVSHIRKNTGLLQIHVPYWRKKYEVDFIADINKQPIPIEVKYSDDIDNKDLRGMVAFMDEKRLKKGIVVTKNIAEIRRIDKKRIILIPVVIMLSGL